MGIYLQEHQVVIYTSEISIIHGESIYDRVTWSYYIIIALILTYMYMYVALFCPHIVDMVVCVCECMRARVIIYLYQANWAMPLCHCSKEWVCESMVSTHCDWYAAFL